MFLKTISLFCLYWQTCHSTEIKNYAKMGVCENVKSEVQRCAMQESDCVPTYIDGEQNVLGEKWYSAYRMEQRGYSRDMCECKNTPLGACVGGAGETGSVELRCAPQRLGYCADGNTESFELLHTGINAGYCKCNAPGNSDQTSLYGACKDNNIDGRNHFCAYAPNMCEGNYEWVEPRKTLEEVGIECECEDVRVGGCVGGFSESHCAVTADDCDWDEFVRPLSLKEKYDTTCYLCKGPDKSGNAETPSSSPLSAEKGLSPGAITGISVGAVAGFLVIGGVAFFAFKNRFGSNPKRDDAGEVVDL